MAKTIPGGYNGKILRINLSEINISVEEIDELFRRKYLGGAGFVSYFLWRELSPGVDPLGPNNKLIFALGPVTGVLLPGSGRNGVGAKSPLTGGIAISEAGEFWGAYSLDTISTGSVIAWSMECFEKGLLGIS